MMNRLFVLTVLSACVAAGTFAEETVQTAENQSAAQHKEALRQRRERIRRYRGDMVAKPGSQQGKLRVVLAAGGISADSIKQQNKTYLGRYPYDFDIVQGEAVSADTAFDAKKKLNANVAVFVVESKNSTPMIVAPEEGWAIVNATACGSASRTEKEVIRALAYVCGAATSEHGFGCMSAAKPAELDAIKAIDMPFDIVQRSEKYLRTIGVTPEIRANYRTACSEGWAPAPTNAVEKAIWDKVHELPAKPLQLKK